MKADRLRAGLRRLLELGTARPLAAYERPEREAEAYAREFSKALGLKPSPTQFGRRKVDV